MKINLVKDEMSTLLENLSEQFDLMDAHEEMIPQIELDIFKRNIQKLYENAIHLNKLNGKEIVSEEFIVEDKKVEEPKIEEKIEIEEVVIEKEIPQATIQEEQVEEPKEIAEEEIQGFIENLSLVARVGNFVINKVQE